MSSSSSDDDDSLDSLSPKASSFFGGGGGSSTSLSVSLAQEGVPLRPAVAVDFELSPAFGACFGFGFEC